MMNNNGMVKKVKTHFKNNKKGYIVGGVCFAAGSVLTYFVARPHIGTLNVYNTYVDKEKAPGVTGASVFGEKAE